ncbi:MAG TPA: SbcC/MukB-like Walker B domain-containing protein [Verrucomicrobiae bacterium]|nr:SbcC/MukB-like Walker B domain-containing protein [Verrucomicrobiae bacterium]
MSQRISLTRIIAIHWYGFRQIFDVDDNVLISGAYGTGKSALLDLMQYVLLGGERQFNRAAAGNARGRDLVGYCLGDTNQTRNGQRHFLRQSGVSLIALEFTRAAQRSESPKRETWGIRLQFSSPDAAPHHTYFCIPDRVEYASLAADGKSLLSDDAFRTWIRREYGNESLFARQRDYLEEMAAPRHLNFDSTAFHRTFPKAIAFEPEENVEKFIREFILEESPLDVRDVKIALRAYEDTRRRLEKQEDEAAFLSRITRQHETYEASRREEAVLSLTFHALKLAQAEERRSELAEKLKRLEAEHAGDVKELENSVATASDLKRLLDQVRFEIGKDPDAVKIAGLASDKSALEKQVEELRTAQMSVRKQLDDRHYRWMNWLKHGSALPLDGLNEALAGNDTLLANLHHGSDPGRLHAMQQLATRFNEELWTSVDQLLQPLRADAASAEKKLRQLAEDLEHLEQGRAPGSFPLFAAMQQKLGSRVEQLGRLIEVKPDAERWWPALELFLGRNRWVLVVNDAADYRDALEMLRKTPPGREPESLLNPAEVRQSRSSALDNALFHKVTVAHPVARAYVEHLLGDVACVETIEELEATDTGRAITPEGIFKQAPLRRRLKPAGAVELTLGREGLQRMRAAKEKERSETRVLHEALKRKLDDVHAWLDSGRKGGLGAGTLPDRASELPQLPDLERNLGRLRETIHLLMTPEREARQQQLADSEKRHGQALAKIAVLKEKNDRFEITIRPDREGLERWTADAEKLSGELVAARVELGRRFSGILDAEIDSQRERFRAEFPRWTDCLEAVQSQMRKASEQAILARAERKAERDALATARDPHGNLRHPEYQHDFPSDDESNDRWANRLQVLESIELQKSRQLADDRRHDWERRLEDSVLNELNRRLTEAQNTIRLLDRYLGQPVGRYRYRISQRKDTAGYGAMWQLLGSGLEITDPLLGTEVERAKRELMDAINNAGHADARVLRMLDYRNYHHYDLEMVPADKPDAPPISLGRSGRNLSGGENQAPFFISMLAAFRRVYDRGDRSSARSQQLGLVVMDEAFSKLSGDGIEDCLALARSFQLQLVMAFPPERLGVMVPHAQTVVMCQKQVERDPDGYVTRIENIPLLTTMAEAMEALT